MLVFYLSITPDLRHASWHHLRQILVIATASCGLNRLVLDFAYRGKISNDIGRLIQLHIGSFRRFQFFHGGKWF